MISISVKDRTWPADRWQSFKAALEEEGASVNFDAKPHGAGEVKVRNLMVSYDKNLARQKGRYEINEVQHEQTLRGICRTYGAEPAF